MKSQARQGLEGIAKKARVVQTFIHAISPLIVRGRVPPEPFCSKGTETSCFFTFPNSNSRPPLSNVEVIPSVLKFWPLARPLLFVRVGSFSQTERIYATVPSQMQRRRICRKYFSSLSFFLVSGLTQILCKPSWFLVLLYCQRPSFLSNLPQTGHARLLKCFGFSWDSANYEIPA